MKVLSFCLFLLLTISCQNHDKPTTSNVESVKEKIQLMNYINSEEIKGWTLEQIKEKYKPIKEESFILEDNLPEFRIELYNYFKNKEDFNKKIEIKEVTWKIDSVNNLTIWFKQESDRWRPVHQLVWDKDSEF